MKFAQFMSTPAGRIIRVVAGLVIIAIGIALQSIGGTILAVIGAFPVVAGILNVCFVAPLLRVPFQGRKLPAAK
jgi:hypothetical protein